ncbi:MAG: glycosyltransferase family 87 protein [Phycisphaerae bacterium]
MKRQALWGLGILAVGIVAYFIGYVWHRIPHGHFGDFRHFYPAAKAMVTGENPYSVRAPDSDRPGYIYPPLLAFLYSPLSYLSLFTAARISLLVNVAAICGALGLGAKTMLERLVGRRVEAWQVMLVAVLGGVLTFDKIKGELQMLQSNALILLALVMALYLLDRAPIWAGVALGFAMNIKYQAIILLPYLLLRRRWKAAGAMVVGTAFWALLPAVLVGPRTELGYLASASGGVLRLLGMDVGNGTVADVEDIKSSFNISITAAVARWEGTSPINPMFIGAAIGLIWLGLMVLVLRRRGIPVLAWPKASEQARTPWARWVGLEWMTVIAATLAFSPQTNSRHLVLASLVNLAAAAIWVSGRGHRWLATLGVVVMVLAVTLPPSQRGDNANLPMLWWHSYGGPAWGVLLGATLVAWAGARDATSRLQLEDRVAGV